MYYWTDHVFQHRSQISLPSWLAETFEFYNAAVLTMITINRESNDMLYLISNSIVDAQDGRTADAEREAQEAISDVKRIEAAQRSAGYGGGELVSRRLAHQCVSHRRNSGNLCALYRRSADATVSPAALE
jgi:hypothetical protein